MFREQTSSKFKTNLFDKLCVYTLTEDTLGRKRMRLEEELGRTGKQTIYVMIEGAELSQGLFCRTRATGCRIRYLAFVSFGS